MEPQDNSLVQIEGARASAAVSVFTKADVPDRIPIMLVAGKAYQVNGQQPVFEFVFKLEQKEDTDEVQRQAILNKLNSSQIDLMRFSILQIEEPKGFGDFPTGDKSTLAIRLRQYFDDDRVRPFVEFALAGYDDAIRPAGFYTSLPNSVLATDSLQQGGGQTRP